MERFMLIRILCAHVMVAHNQRGGEDAGGGHGHSGAAGPA
jgi:hypothetical protein